MLLPSLAQWIWYLARLIDSGSGSGLSLFQLAVISVLCVFQYAKAASLCLSRFHHQEASTACSTMHIVIQAASPPPPVARRVQSRSRFHKSRSSIGLISCARLLQQPSLARIDSAAPTAPSAPLSCGASCDDRVRAAGRLFTQPRLSVLKDCHHLICGLADRHSALRSLADREYKSSSLGARQQAGTDSGRAGQKTQPVWTL